MPNTNTYQIVCTYFEVFLYFWGRIRLNSKYERKCRPLREFYLIKHHTTYDYVYFTYFVLCVRFFLDKYRI